MAKKTNTPIDSVVPPNVQIVDAATLTPDEHNANRGTSRGRQMVKDSFRRLKAGRSIVLDSQGRVIAGNKSLEAYMANGGKQVIVIPSDGDVLIAHQRTDLDLEKGTEARELAFADNRTAQVGIEFDEVKVIEAHDFGIDLTPYWTGAELSIMIENTTKFFEKEEEMATDEDGTALVDDVEEVSGELPGVLALKKDMIFPSSQPHDIPELLPSMCCAIPEPIQTWGGDDIMACDPASHYLVLWGYGLRGVNIHRAVMGFYVEDIKFEQIWMYPDVYTAKMVNLGIETAIVPDVSMWLNTAEAVNIYSVFKARWMGRYFQEAGIQVIPNVGWGDDRSFRYCLSGIPEDAPAIAMQIQTDIETKTKEDDTLRLLTNITNVINTLRPQSMLLYGGGKEIKARVASILPKQLHIVWVENRSAVRRPHISNRGMSW